MSDAQRLREGAGWLIGWRWVAAVWACVGTLLAGRLLGIGVATGPILAVVGVLTLANLLFWIVSRRLAREAEGSTRAPRRLIRVQMTTDLLLLTVLCHYAGGVENPFVLFYVFHVLIAVVLISIREGCLQATVGVVLFTTLVVLEYAGRIPHHCLRGFLPHSLHDNARYVGGVLVGFTTAMYLVVYLGGFVAERLRQAEALQSRANADLRRKDRIKDEYVHRVSHDIKGHVAAIQTCLSVATQAGGVSRAERDAFAERALTRTRRLLHFIRDLLRLTQVRLDRHAAVERFLFEGTLRHAVDTIAPTAEAGQVSLAVEIPGSRTPVCGSALVLEEVVTNLLSNAVKYTPAGGRVSLEAAVENEGVRVTVQDTGVGIPEEECARVFEEFYRATNVRGGGREGSGMGLALVRHMVRTHGGDICLNSELEVGTRVSVSLPWLSPPPTTGSAISTQGHGTREDLENEKKEVAL